MRLLVIRLSALGDVAILAPVLRARAAANPGTTFLLAAPPLLQPLFAGIEGVEFIATPRRQSPRELARQWIALRPDLVADLHGVPRVRRALCRLRLHGVAVRHIRKERWRRWRLTRRRCKTRRRLTAAWQRYDRVFDACGLQPAAAIAAESMQPLAPRRAADGLRHIGLAPGAQHRGKIWPAAYMETLVRQLSADPRNRLLLFGGAEDKPQLERWSAAYPNTRSLACRGSFADELQAMAALDLMVSMDSANMHFASALGVPVVSIWGATHPFAGFYGWRQHPGNALQAALPCRPCSAYGQKACRYGDYRCLHAVTPDAVLRKINELTDSPYLTPDGRTTVNVDP